MAVRSFVRTILKFPELEAYRHLMPVRRCQTDCLSVIREIIQDSVDNMKKMLAQSGDPKPTEAHLFSQGYQAMRKMLP